MWFKVKVLIVLVIFCFIGCALKMSVLYLHSSSLQKVTILVTCCKLANMQPNLISTGLEKKFQKQSE